MTKPPAAARTRRKFSFVLGWRCLERFSLEWAQMQDNLGNAFKQLGARQGSTGRLGKPSPPTVRSLVPAKIDRRPPILKQKDSYDLVSTGANRNLMRDGNLLPIVVVVRLPESGWSIRLRSCIVNAHSRRSSDGSASSIMDRILSGVFPEPIPLCGEESDEIPDRDLFNARTTRAMFEGFPFR